MARPQIGGVLPEETGIDLPGRDQLLQPAEAGERRAGKDRLAHSDMLKQIDELPRASLRVPRAAELGQMPSDLGEFGAVAAIVAAGRAEADRAIRQDFGNDAGD